MLPLPTDAASGSPTRCPLPRCRGSVCRCPLLSAAAAPRFKLHPQQPSVDLLCRHEPGPAQPTRSSALSL